jgi:hypothetical protein
MLILRVSILTIIGRLLIILLLLLRFSHISLMIPFLVEEVREPSRAYMYQFVKYGRYHSLIVDLKVKACVSRQSQELLQDKARAPLEDGVYHREDEAGVGLTLVLVQKNRILNVEM